jgi:hypothetical protein
MPRHHTLAPCSNFLNAHDDGDALGPSRDASELARYLVSQERAPAGAATLPVTSVQPDTLTATLGAPVVGGKNTVSVPPSSRPEALPSMRRGLGCRGFECLKLVAACEHRNTTSTQSLILVTVVVAGVAL